MNNELGVDVEITPGARGEFSVLVGGRRVAKRGWFGPPSSAKVLRRVRKALR